MKYQLTLITQQQNKIEKAQKLAQGIRDMLGGGVETRTGKYEKFPNSYQIVITGNLDSASSVEQSIELRDRLCSPWKVTYHRDSGLVELIFNTSDGSRYTSPTFNVISWGILRYLMLPSICLM